MNSQPSQPHNSPSSDETQIRTLYQQLLDGWNKHNAEAMAILFTKDSDLIGFDGSQLSGRAEITSTLQQIFADHVTPPYTSKIKSVRFLSPEVAILRAIVGMVPPGKSDLDPNLNAIQTLIATKQDSKWRIVLFQNTPAQFHGRPELVNAMTEELRQVRD